MGRNGAGKATLVKLLARLYDSTEGVIRLDGVDLREYDLDDLRRQIGVIFQGFVRYELTALDAQMEYELFQRFRELATGRTVPLISHRFSTVRMAGRYR